MRLPRVLADDFPINDGGIFFVMTNELVSAKLALPSTTAYNGARIPFAYPPLGLYVTAAIHLATGASVLGLLRFLPLIANLGAAAVCFFLARLILGTTSRAGLATLILVLLPRSYEWLIMGGGLTRSFGFLFACLAVACGHRLFVDRRTAAGVPAAVALALAVLSHPEMGLWATASLLLVAIAAGLERWTIAAWVLVAAGAAAIASPWWVTTLMRHGTGPFLAAFGTSKWGLRSMIGLVNRGIGGEVGIAPFAILALVGLLDAVIRREYLLPAWLVGTFVVVPRSATTEAIVPMAFLAARALVGVLFPLLDRTVAGVRAARRETPGKLGHDAAPGRARRVLQAAVLVPIFGYTLIVSNLGRSPENWPAMRRVPPAEREAMAWIGSNVDGERRFVVVSASRGWWMDPVDAWFPALTGKVSVVTPNGAEWLPRREFARRIEAYDALKQCKKLDSAFLDAWSARFGLGFSHVYVSKPRLVAGAPAAPKATLAASDTFVVAYDGPGATVFARREAVGNAALPASPPRRAGTPDVTTTIAPSHGAADGPVRLRDGDDPDMASQRLGSADGRSGRRSTYVGRVGDARSGAAGNVSRRTR